MANMGVTSQLELLKGFHQKDLGFSSEDEVEVPDFQETNLDHDKNDECNNSICHPDGCISDVKKGRKIPSKSTTIGNSVSEMLDHYTKGNKKQSEPCTFSAVDAEANRKDTCCPFSSKDKYTGGRSKTKRSSSQTPERKQRAYWSLWKGKDPNLSSDDELLDEAEVRESQPINIINSVVPGGCDGEMSKSNVVLPSNAALEHDFPRNSMAELLENRRGKIRNLHLKSKKVPCGLNSYWSLWNGKDPNLSSDDELLDEAEVREYQPINNINSVFLGGCDGEMSKSNVVLPSNAALQHDFPRNSMAELLENRQGKIRNLHLKSKKGGRRKGLGQRTAVRLSGKDVMSDEDPCEFIQSESSTDNEDNAETSDQAIVKTERKTMADKFHEAFGYASVEDRRPSFILPKQSSTGLFGRLQHMMQQQKEQYAEFIKKVQTEVWPKDEARCIDVKILSRSFDAKLSVCRCSLLENEESSLQNPPQENFGKLWTVIFNPRVCVDVDLEVGNLIRIYPPWKEVQILRGGEVVILTIYFSQIHT